MELWDLYDENRNVTGRTMVRGTPIPEGYYRLVAHVCIFDREGRMLIQHRVPTKRGWPDRWDLSAGGAAVAGDTSRTCAERETFEELGVRLDLSGTRPVLCVNFYEGFNDVYCVTADVDLNTVKLQPTETDAVRWATEEEVLALIDEDKFIPYHKGYISFLFHLKNNVNVHTKRDPNNRFAK